MASDTTSAGSPKENAEKVLSALFPFAKQMLEQQGGFYPFGGAVLADGTITMVSDDGGGSANPPSQEVIERLLGNFRAAAKLGTYRVVGIAYEITTVPPGATDKTDAIVIRLDTKGYSVQVVYPYRIPKPGEVVIAEPYAVQGPGDVFP